MRKFFLLLVLSLVIPQLSSKDPLNFLINKFEKKMDTNVYYLLNFERQQNNRHFCNSADGPYCSFLNDRSLGSEVLDNSETKKIKQTVKNNVRNWIEQFMGQKKQGQNSVFYYFDQQRDNLDQIYEQQGQFSGSPMLIPEVQSAIPKTIAEVFLDLDNLPVENKEYGLDMAFKVAIGQNPSGQPEYVTTTFEGFFVPAKEKIIYKRVKNEKLQDLEDSSRIQPNGVYIRSAVKDGWMSFSRPVKMKSIYIRKHDFALYKREVGRKIEAGVKYYVQGLNGKTLIFDIEITNQNTNFNSWVQILFPESYGNIDKVIFEANTDLDNVYFALEDQAAPEITSERIIEDLLEGMEEDMESEFSFSNTDPTGKADGPLKHQNQPIENPSKPVENPSKPIENPNPQKKGGSYSQGKPNPVRKTKEKSTNSGKTGSSTKNNQGIVPKKEGNIKTTNDFFERVMELVEMLSEEQALLRSFEELDDDQLERLRKDLRVYLKDFPQFEEYLENVEKDPELLLELLDEIEERYPEIKPVFRDAMIRSKQRNVKKGEEEKKKAVGV